MSASRLRTVDAPRPADLPGTPAAFLAGLGRPTLLRIPGRDRSRVRVVTTLLHGNEPSGLRALHAWLRSDPAPAVDVIAIIASVETAMHGDGFVHRALPGRRDLNRCFFGPADDPEGALAAAILEALRAAAPEAVIDIHNNTGHNPAYAVGPHAGERELALCAHFGDRFVHSTLRLGALVEATIGFAPSATIEVGRAGDPAADRTALVGLESYVAAEDPTAAPEGDRTMQVYQDPRRVSLRPGISLAFADAPVEGADLTIRADVERHNFVTVAAGEPIGWVRADVDRPLEVRCADGRDHTDDSFAISEGRLALRRGGVPIMVTTNAAVARSDCLFYLVQPVEMETPKRRPEDAASSQDPASQI